MVDRTFISETFFKLSKYEELRERTFPSIYFNKCAKAIKYSTNIEYLDNGRVKVTTNFGEMILGETSSELFLEMDKDKLCSRLIEYERSYGSLSSLENGEEITEKRITYESAKQLVDYINNRIDTKRSELNINFTYEVAGSFRRQKSTIGDLDYIVTNFKDEDLGNIITIYSSLFERKLVSGSKKIAGIIKGFQVDIRFINKNEYPCMLMHATGPKEFNISIRKKARSLGFKLNEYCISDSSGNSIYPESEKQIFELLNLRYVEPKCR
jgi:hypothetical protein